MRNSSLQEKAEGNILQAAFESSSWEDFGARAIQSLDDLFNTSLSILFRSDERGPVIASAGAVEIHLQWAERYFEHDPMIPAIRVRNQGLLQASDCPEWKAFLNAPVYLDLAKSCGVHDYLMFRFTDTLPYKSGAVQLLLARGPHQPSFTREERRRAEKLLPPLNALGRWIEHSRNLSESCSTLEEILKSEDRLKIAFDVDGKLLCATQGAEELVGVPEHGRIQIAEELLAAVRRLGNFAKRPMGEAPAPDVALFGKKSQPIRVNLRLGQTRSGKRFVLAEIDPIAVMARRYGLTAAETQVLRLLAQGLSDREIAQRLFVSPETVHTHAGHLFGKLGVSSRVKAALMAHGLPLDDREP